VSAACLTLRLTRLSPTHHRLDILRAGAAPESVELDTKSFLVHDLLHFAVETEANLAHAFFGCLAAGQSYAGLAAAGAPRGGELLTAERIVGPMTSVVRGTVAPGAFRTGLANLYDALGEPLPAFITEEFVAAVLAHYRALAGRWKATPFGQAMELRFPVPAH
jgi:hypothetical protein